MSDNPPSPFDPDTGRLTSGGSFYDPSAPSVGSVVDNALDMGAIPSTVRSSLITDPLRAAALNTVFRFMALPSEQITNAMDTFATARSALNGSMGAMVDLAVLMARSGIDAMIAGQEVDRIMATTYAFGYWIGEYRGAMKYSNPPSTIVDYYRERDRRQHEIDRQRGEAGTWHPSSAQTRLARWTETHHSAFEAFSSSVDYRTMFNYVTRRSPQLNFARTNTPMEAQETMVRRMWRGFLLAEFDNDPEKAAAVFLASQMQSASAAVQRAVLPVYRNNPYRAVLP